MYRVMIVDDMEILRRDVKRLKLWGESSGFVIAEEARDGLDALKKLEAGPVDLVITDIRMPNMDGIELLRHISGKKLCPFTVLLSDYTEYGYAKQAFLYGAFDYIGKPVDETELAGLLERIRQHLDERREEEQQLTELREIVDEAFFTAADVEQIIAAVCRADTKAVAMTADMVDTVGASFDCDAAKAAWILKNAVGEMAKGTLKNHPWLTQYIDADSLRNIDFTNCKDWKEVKTAVVGAAEELIFAVSKFIGRHDNGMVKQTCEYVLGHIDNELSVKMLAEKLYISKSYLSDIFRQKFGVSLLEYITMVKIERAKRLLAAEDLKNYEIAYKLGFQDNEYFNKVFKKHTGMSLTEFRAKRQPR